MIRVRISDPRSEGVCCNFKTVKSGVPQGSLLGPLLFNIFINDLNFCVSNVSLRLYVDETTAYLSDVSPTILEFSFNKDLQTLSSWFESNHLRWLNTVLAVSEYRSFAKLWQEKSCSSQAETWQVKNIMMNDFD